MGLVDVAEDVPRAPWVYSESLVTLQIDSVDRGRADDLEAAIREWTRDFLARWAFRDGVQLTGEDLYDLSDEVTLTHIRKTRDRSVLFDIVKAPSNEAFQAIIDDLIVTLTGLNIDTSIQLYRPPSPTVLRYDRPPLTGVAIHISPLLTDDALSRPPGVNLPSHPIPPVRRRDLREGVLDALIDHAVEWCPVTSGNLFLLTGSEQFRLQLSEAESVLREYLEKDDLSQVYFVCENAAGEARAVVFTGHAQVLYVRTRYGDDYELPAEALDHVVEVLSDLAPHIAAGAAHRTVGVPRDLHGLMDDGPDDRVMNSEWANRVLSETWLMDAFPVIYLGPGFPGMKDRFATYETRTLPPGQLLVSDELDTWFVPTRRRRRPADDAAIAAERARQDLRDIIITQPQANEKIRVERERWVRDFPNNGAATP